MSQKLRYQQWICFEIAKETYAHRVADVQEILSYQQAVPVPGSPDIVEGVLNIRGEIVTVVSSTRLMGLANNVAAPEHIIVLLTDAGSVGVIVDKVDQIRVLDRNNMDSLENSDDSSPIKGTINHKDQLLILTDFNRCIRARENI